MWEHIATRYAFGGLKGQGKRGPGRAPQGHANFPQWHEGWSFVAWHHVNFHTAHNKPVFHVDEFDAMLRACLGFVLANREINCPVWEIMPTHVHLIVEDEPSKPLSMIMKHLKGDTSRAFFRNYPDLRHDLYGGHLWARGYYSVAIQTADQYRAARAYIRANRRQAGLSAPAAPNPDTI
jgi:putative transposase